MLRVRLLNMFVLFALSINMICSPLLAMEEEQEQTRHPIRPLKSVVYESVITGGIGALLFYGTFWQEDKYDSSFTGQLKSTATWISPIAAAQLITTAFSDFFSCLYENWRYDSKENQIKRLIKEINDLRNVGKKKIKNAQEKREELQSNIQYLKKVKPREEFILYKNYLNYGLDILQGLVIAGFTIDVLYKHSNELDYGFSILQTEQCVKYGNDMTCEEFTIKPHINLWTLPATLINGCWTLRNVYRQWNKEKLEQERPIKSFLRAASSLGTQLSTAKRVDSYLKSLIIRASSATINAVKRGHITSDKENLSKYYRNHINNSTFYHVIGNIYVIYHFNMCLQLGNGFLAFFQGCHELYEYKNYWFGLVDDLAEEDTPQEEKKNSKQESPELSEVESETSFNEAVIQEPLEQSLIEENGSTLTNGSEKEPVEDRETMLKAPKKKTRGTPNKHLFPSKKKALTPINLIEIETEEDHQRKENLANIEEMRRGNSVPSHKLESEFKRAAKFVNEGQFKAVGNSFSIKWKRGTRERSVNFEWSHNQSNEKASVFKGKKLEKALDALEQLYLDGWQKRKILDHLNGRFLYNVPYWLLHILWTSPEEREGS